MLPPVYVAPMCGRYVLHGPVSRYQAYFDAKLISAFEARWNLAPSQQAPVVRQDPEGRRFEIAEWGLLPSWVKDPKAIKHPVNAKAETAAEKPMYRRAWRFGRVLVPADGFYEWQEKPGGDKQPFYIHAADGQPLAIAGLLERWHGPERERTTFAILTTEPNQMMRALHDRMPLIIQPKDFAAWLDPSPAAAEAAKALTGPPPDGMLVAHPVSRRVNSPKNEGDDLIAPVEPSAGW